MLLTLLTVAEILGSRQNAVNIGCLIRYDTNLPILTTSSNILQCWRRRAWPATKFSYTVEAGLFPAVGRRVSEEPEEERERERKKRKKETRKEKGRREEEEDVEDEEDEEDEEVSHTVENIPT